MEQKSKFKNFLKTFGPGIMFAGTCIGGSHLIQSTKAGAFYGFGLLSIIIIANIVKYPFFEFASRYTNATGDSILEGYKKIGNWTLYIYGAVTLFSMFIITAAIAAMTSGLASNMFIELFDIYLTPLQWDIFLLSLVAVLLITGKFGALDITLKIVGLVLVLTICIAFFSVIQKKFPHESPATFDILTSSPNGLMFTIALMGWMPMGVDMSAWHSLWTQERIKQTGYHPTLKETLLDLNIGYFITVVLAVFFMVIGAYVLYQHTEYTPEAIGKMGGMKYANTLVSVFTSAVGSWSKIIIMVACFATMLGTLITLTDGYTRSLLRTVHLLAPEKKLESKKGFIITLSILLIGTILFKLQIGDNLGKTVNIATVTSFIIAPLAAFLNFRIMYNSEVKQEYKPNIILKTLAVIGIVFMTTFCIVYLIQNFSN